MVLELLSLWEFDVAKDDLERYGTTSQGDDDGVDAKRHDDESVGGCWRSKEGVTALAIERVVVIVEEK